MSNTNQAMQNASNLQKELLAMSVAAASMNQGMKEQDLQSNKSKKGKGSSRGSMSQNNKSLSQQLQATSGRGRDSGNDGSYNSSKSNNDVMKSAGYSR